MRTVSWIFLGLGFFLAGIGFVTNAMWRILPWESISLIAGVVGASLIVAYGLKQLFRCALATTVGLVWLMALIYFAGLSVPMAVLFIAMAAMALGSLVVPADVGARWALSVLVGLALLCGIDGWLLPFPIHYRATYFAALSLLIAIRWRAIVALVGPISRSWRDAVDASPGAALLTMTALGAASMFAWVPTIHNDDLAYHLGLPTQLYNLGYYTMAAASGVWSLSAWSADVLQGIAYLLAAGDARGTVDVLWLLLAATLLWKLGESLELEPWMRWLVVALYVSQPTTASSLGVMQTEGPTAALTVGLALIIQSKSRGDDRLLLTVAMLFGLLLGLKVSNLTVAGPLGLWLLWRWRRSMPWQLVPLALTLIFIVGGASYVYAYMFTGNPVLPIFNEIFRSPYFGLYNFDNTTWNTGLNWSILWDMVFHTSKYVEGYDGGAGFVLIALSGALLTALLDRRTRPLALVGIAAFLLPLTQTQYLRYATPALGLLIPATLASIRMDGTDIWHVRAVVSMLVALILANLAFAPNSDWQVRGGVLAQLLAEGSSAVVSQHAPERQIAEFVRMRYGAGARVLVVSQKACFGAPFGGYAFVRCWYDPTLQNLSKQADADLSGASWLQVFSSTGVNLLVLRKEDVSLALATAIEKEGGERVYTVGGVELWALHSSVAGTLVPSPSKTLLVQFDTSTAPTGASLLDVHVELSCVPSETPIVVGWIVTMQGGKQVTRYNWAKCLDSGRTRDAIHLDIPGKLAKLSVSAAPAYGKDLGLVLKSANASWRKDLMMERDLAARMRGSLRRALADWIDPKAKAGAGVMGYAVVSPARSLVAKLNTATFPSGASQVKAALILRCDRQDVPIVLGWKVDEVNGEPWTRYELATCGADGRVRASIDMRTSRKVSGLMVTAVPNGSVDVGLGLVSLQADFLSVTGLSGLVNRKRLKLAEWIAPENNTKRLIP